MAKNKTKILFLNYEFPPLGGGAGNATKYLFLEFAKQEDLEIDLITSSTDKFKIEKFAKNIRVHYLDIGKKGNIHYQSNSDLLKYSWKAYFYGKGLIKKKKFDLTHAFFGIPCGYIAMKLGLPYIVSLRGSDVPFYNPRFAKLDKLVFCRLSQRIWRRARAVIANSEGLKELAEKTFAGGIGVIPNGVDTSEFKPLKNKKISKKIRLISTGRLIARKGYQYLIPALKGLKNVELTLVGGGDLRSELDELARKNQVKVHFTGEVKHDEIVKYLQNSDIFVLPSLNEGMSNSILEAMACGLPIITTNTGGSKELIDENGFIIKKNSIIDIKNKLTTYLKNVQKLNDHGQKSRLIAQTLSWELVSDNYQKLYRFPSKTVLVDGRAFIREGSSASSYLFNLLSELKKEQSLKIILVINNQKYLGKFDHPNVKTIFSKVKNNLLWDNFVIPYQAIKNQTKIVFYPKSSSPFFRLPRKKIVTTIHGMIYKFDRSIPFLTRIYWRFVGKLASIVTNKIIAVSKNDKKDLIGEGYKSDKIEVIPIGVSRIFFDDYPYNQTKEVLKKFGLQKSKYLIQVAKITEKKNQLFSLDLFKMIKNRGFKMVFIGNTKADEVYYQKVCEQIKKNNLQTKVIFTGPIDQNRKPWIIPILLKNSVLAVFPSLYEGFGIPPMEAMASGTPVVMSDRGALKEIYGQDFTFPLEDKIKWTNVVNDLINNKKFKKSYLEKQTVLAKNYHWEAVAKRYSKLFRDI